MLVAINQLGFGAIVAVVALYASSFGVGQSAIGIAIAVYGLARFLVAMPAGQLADRVGRRGVLALGGLVTAAGNLLCAYAPTYALFIGGRFVAGAGASLVLIGGTIVLADITTPANRGRTMAIYQGVFLFAVGVGPVPGGLLAERLGLTAPFVVYAIAGVVAAGVAWMAVPETRGGHASAAAVAAAELPAFGAQVRLLTGRIGFVLTTLVSFVGAVARTSA
ncbi:MAG TPA: MFS transporter, partial [Methylomirabilota bacterium]|nr:MFS transporter [Methylomirabilota bacterium]